MTFVHGKNTYVSINGVNLSAYCDSFELERAADSHDVTTYGKTAHVKAGGLLDGSAKVSGIYDSTTGTGPRATLVPICGAVVTMIYRPEGTGTGKPQDSVSALVGKYAETAPVADMVKWSCELDLSDSITTSTQ